jgi:hypothetical protein
MKLLQVEIQSNSTAFIHTKCKKKKKSRKMSRICLEAPFVFLSLHKLLFFLLFAIVIILFLSLFVSSCLLFTVSPVRRKRNFCDFIYNSRRRSLLLTCLHLHTLSLSSAVFCHSSHFGYQIGFINRGFCASRCFSPQGLHFFTRH